MKRDGLIEWWPECGAASSLSSWTNLARKEEGVRATPFPIPVLEPRLIKHSGSLVCCIGGAGDAIRVSDHPETGLPRLYRFLCVQCCDDRKRLGLRLLTSWVPKDGSLADLVGAPGPW